MLSYLGIGSMRHPVTSGHIEALSYNGHDMVVHYKKGKPYTHLMSREEFNAIMLRHENGESIGKMIGALSKGRSNERML